MSEKPHKPALDPLEVIRDQALTTPASVRLTVPLLTKARWVRASRAEGKTLTDFVVSRLEVSPSKLPPDIAPETANFDVRERAMKVFQAQVQHSLASGETVYLGAGNSYNGVKSVIYPAAPTGSDSYEIANAAVRLLLDTERAIRKAGWTGKSALPDELRSLAERLENGEFSRVRRGLNEIATAVKAADSKS